MERKRTFKLCRPERAWKLAIKPGLPENSAGSSGRAASYNENPKINKCKNKLNTMMYGC